MEGVSLDFDDEDSLDEAAAPLLLLSEAVAGVVLDPEVSLEVSGLVVEPFDLA